MPQAGVRHPEVIFEFQRVDAVRLLGECVQGDTPSGPQQLGALGHAANDQQLLMVADVARECLAARSL